MNSAGFGASSGGGVLSGGGLLRFDYLVYMERRTNSLRL